MSKFITISKWQKKNEILETFHPCTMFALQDGCGSIHFDGSFLGFLTKKNINYCRNFCNAHSIIIFIIFKLLFFKVDFLFISQNQRKFSFVTSSKVL